ncbi:hypothetical protein FQZ97_1147680 [compost metagenome]
MSRVPLRVRTVGLPSKVFFTSSVTTTACAPNSREACCTRSGTSNAAAPSEIFSIPSAYKRRISSIVRTPPP